MKAILEATVELWEFVVFAELAVWEPRPDLRVLCAAAQDRGALNEDAIDAVIPGLSPRGRKNLLHRAQDLQLVDRTGVLTAVGRRCASVGSAPAWEQGVYRLLVAAHPLFGGQVLAFQRASTDGADRDFDSLLPLPAWLTANHERVFTSAFDREARFSIGAFPSVSSEEPVCRGWELDPGRLRWEIDLATRANQWTIEGAVGTSDRKPFRTAPESVEASELEGLFRAWEPRWDARLGRAAIPYDGLVPAHGRELFLRTWKYPRVRVGRFGSFDEAVVHDIPVAPATDQDARTWATAIVLARTEAAEAYVAPVQWETEWAVTVGGPPLAGRAGDAPDAAGLDMVDGKAVALRTRWLLAAGADLRMGE